MLRRVFLAAVYIAGVFCMPEETTESPDCSKSTLFSCSYPVQNVEFNQLHFISSKEELKPLCQELHTSLRCIDNYTRSCMTPNQRSHFNQLYSGTSLVIQEICTEGHYQEEFLKQAACTKQLAEEYKECANGFQAELEAIHQPAGQDNVASSICCPLHSYLSCSKELVRKNCGEESANFSAGFLDKMSQAIITAHCEGAICTDGGLQINGASSSILTVLTMALLVLHFPTFS